MAQARHVLKSAALPRVTHARLAKDHTPGASAHESVGLNALLFWAVGLVPFKDGFWSTARQPGRAPCADGAEWCGGAMKKDYAGDGVDGPDVEPNPELEALTSTL